MFSPPTPLASTADVTGSSSTSIGNPPGSTAVTAAMVSTAAGADSASMNAIRSAGYDGSTGGHPAPDLSTPSTAVIMSAERGSAMATSRPGPAPTVIRYRASRLA